MDTTIFYSWQSDLPNATNRGFIEIALERAIQALHADATVEAALRLEQDTAGVAGAPNIGQTISAKIDAATVFVADVSLINQGSVFPDGDPRASTGPPRSMPNPNVLVELGYAVKTLGWGRIILVLNTAFGSPEHLPFDFRQHRALTYRAQEGDTSRAGERTELQRGLEAALRAVLNTTPPIPSLTLREKALRYLELTAAMRAEQWKQVQHLAVGLGEDYEDVPALLQRATQEQERLNRLLAALPSAIRTTDWVRVIRLVRDMGFAASEEFLQMARRTWTQIAIEGQELHHEIIAEKPRVAAIVTTSDGRQILASFSNSILRRWEVDTGQALQSFRVQRGPAQALAVLLDGVTLLTSEQDIVNHWDVTNRAVLQRFPKSWQTSPANVSTLAILPGETHFLAGYTSGQIMLWEVRGGRLVCHLAGLDAAIQTLQLHADGQSVFAVDAEGTVAQWDLPSFSPAPDHRPETHEPRDTFSHPGLRSTAVALSTDGTYLISGQRTYVAVTRLGGMSDVSFQTDNQEITTLTLTSDGRHLLCGTAEGQVLIRAWDFQANDLGRTLYMTARNQRPIAPQPAITALTISADGCWIVAGRADGTVWRWQVPVGLLGPLPETPADATAAA